MPIFALALKSLMNRRATAALVVLSIAVSVLLLLGVEKLRADAKASFADTVSGVDLVVGARTGPIPLLLYSVFRIGDATNNISWRSYQDVAARPGVAWTVPLSLGDSHRGFRVLGTTLDYFSRYRYGRDRNLVFRAGEPFDDLYDVVLGADVAATLGYALGDRIVIAHGLGEAGFQKHEDKPFRVVGVLAKTGTPVDRTLHVSLEAIEAIHVDWRGGVRTPGMHATADEARAMDLRPKQITAFLVGLENRVAVFGLQRWINEYRREPLLAVLPGVALQQLWDLMGTAETALAAVSGAVVGTGLLGMLTMLLAGLAERRREMALLRAVGAVIKGVDLVMRGTVDNAFCAVRPPGHHAEPNRVMGFCFFNNAAVAAQYLRDYGLHRIAILDVDYHHGNGQQDIFYERSDVLTVSIHGDPSFAYPYFTGFRNETGRNDGAGFNLNLPLPET